MPLGLAHHNLQEASSTAVRSLYINDFSCDVAKNGCRAWCAGTTCTVQSRCGRAAGLTVVQTAKAVRGSNNKWSHMAACPAGHAVTACGRIDIVEASAKAGDVDYLHVNDFEAFDAGCRAFCYGAPCDVKAQCASADLQIQTTTGKSQKALKGAWTGRRPVTTLHPPALCR